MSKPVKQLLTRELAERYQAVNNAIWVELVGVDGITTNEFRRVLRGRNMRLEVVKTSLFQAACKDGPLAALAAALRGPVALVTGGESAIDAAKLLDEWLPKLQTKLRLRGAVLEGEYLDESRVKELSKMPTKHDLQARIALLIVTPGGLVAGATLAPGRNLAGCLKAFIEKLEKAAPAEPAAA
jgi:large subunit ribosomal protein L10